jgi:hypothetical protein
MSFLGGVVVVSASHYVICVQSDNNKNKSNLDVAS